MSKDSRPTPRLSDMAAPIPMPPHAYVPGLNPRPPEDWFDAIKSTVQVGVSLADLQHTQAFRAGLAYLDAGYYWECHEVLEAVWMQTPEGTAEREMVQALIQLANAQLKVLMGRPRAATRLCDMVQEHLQNCTEGQPILGLQSKAVLARVETLRAYLAKG